MKAIVQYRYGAADVLQVKELDKPTPNKNQILVKIIASSVTRGGRDDAPRKP